MRIYRRDYNMPEPVMYGLMGVLIFILILATLGWFFMAKDEELGFLFLLYIAGMVIMSIWFGSNI